MNVAVASVHQPPAKVNVKVPIENGSRRPSKSRGQSNCSTTLPPISMQESHEAPKEQRKGSKKSVASVSTVDTIALRTSTTDSKALESTMSTQSEEWQHEDVQSELDSFCAGSTVPTTGSSSLPSCISSPRDSINIEPPPRENSTVPRFRRKVAIQGKVQTQQALINSSVSLSDLHNAICDVTSSAEVAYVCSRGQAEQVPPSIPITILSGGGPCQFPEKLSHANVAVLVVEDTEDCVDRAINILGKVPESMMGAVSVLLMGHHRNYEHRNVATKIVRLVQAGADDVALVPKDTSQLHCMIAASLGKAEMSNRQRDHFERKLATSNTQCHRLFWQIAHEVLEGMPRVRENIAEVYGEKVGNIELLKKVGKGASCDVYMCRNASKDKNCVVKVFKKNAIRSVDQLAQVVVEYETLRTLKHPNIVEGVNLVHGVQNLYLFMENAGPQNLFRVIKSEGEQGLLWSRARELLLDIFAGVTHMHGNEVAHCDLKPENIVISSEGRAKLIDLGQVVHMTDVPQLKSPRGTMPFMAPEMMQVNANWNPIRTDLWSLGVIMVEMICGNHMFASILGWRDRDLDSMPELTKCADELSIVFATQSKDKVLTGMLELCHSPPPSFVRSLLADLLELVPESRLHAKQVLSSLEESL